MPKVTSSVVAFGALVAAFLVCGCSGTKSPGTPETAGAALPGVRGLVHGGQQPVTGASIQLYAVGTGGDGSAATPLLSPAAVTDGNGNFNITGTYTCPASNPLVYIVATGGNPSPSMSNPNLALMAALGPCNNLNASTYIAINELTTVGAVYPLAPFISSPSAIGSGTSDAASLASAFTLASELVNTATGTSPGTNVPAGVTIPVAQIDTLGDILASCINSAGGTSGDGSSCGSLFSLTTPSTTPATAPATNTIAALLNLANNPTLNTAALYSMAAAVAPFQPVEATTPSGFAVQPSSSGLSVSTGSLSFGSWTVGFTSFGQMITFSNQSGSTVTPNPMIVGSDASSFSLVTPEGQCGVSVISPTLCQYEVDFVPQAVGSLSAYLVLSGNPIIEVPLSGTGLALTAGSVTFSPNSLSFSIADTAQDIMLENLGNTSVTISGIGTNSPYFTETNNCGTTLPAQSACTVSVTSNGINWPADDGLLPETYTGTLTVYDNVSPGTQTVSLTSTNRAYVYDSVFTAALNFGSSQIGSTVTQTLSISSFTNYVATPITQVSLGGANPGDFSIVNPSGPCLAINQQPCVYTIAFTPSAAGTRSAGFYVNGTNQYFPLTGTGVATGPLP